MKPKPFSSLNHFTVPVGTVLPSTAGVLHARRSAVSNGPAYVALLSAGISPGLPRQNVPGTTRARHPPRRGIPASVGEARDARQRLVALDHAPAHGVALGTVVDEVPRAIRDLACVLRRRRFPQALDQQQLESLDLLLGRSGRQSRERLAGDLAPHSGGDEQAVAKGDGVHGSEGARGARGILDRIAPRERAGRGAAAPRTFVHGRRRSSYRLGAQQPISGGMPIPSRSLQPRVLLLVLALLGTLLVLPAAPAAAAPGACSASHATVRKASIRR